MSDISMPHRLADEQESPKGYWLSGSFFTLSILYHELLLRLFDQSNTFFEISLIPLLAMSATAGLIFTLLLDLIRHREISTGIAIGAIAIWTILVCVEYCCQSYYKIYYGVGYIINMTGNVVGDFADTMLEVVLVRIPFILLSLVPLIAMIIFRKRILPSTRFSTVACWFIAIIAVFLQVIGSLMGLFGVNKDAYTYNYSADNAIPHFGLVTSVRLEAEYAIFGTPAAPMVDLSDIIDIKTVDHPQATVYGDNVLDFDFDALANSSSGTIQSINRYFAGKTPTQKNQYTGMFAGKNLILITAESFSPYVISQELTPALYRLTHESFVFNNFYQPGWGQSTTGGEFAVMTGLLPTWVGNQVSFYVSADDDMPLALGNQFRALGYSTLAWHNNTYTYYDRDKTHPNLGYDYRGVGNGLVMASAAQNPWPYSDLEMFQATADEYLEAYQKDGTPFHAYYMTVSGHASWNWGNSMSGKNRAVAEAAYPNASQTVQGYIAANLELEYAMEYLLEELEKYGALEDTVICMCADHYPYAMVTEDVDYYQELSGIQDTEQDASRYRNTLVLWCGSMTEPIVVDTPCSSVDIVPTLSNLFGLEYDSRLLSGRDIFADYTPSVASTNMPLVILPTPGGNSWVTAAGTYDSSLQRFTPNPGIRVDSNYVSTVNGIVGAKYSYAKAVIQYDYYRTLFGNTTAAAVAPTSSAENVAAEDGSIAETTPQP